jgi:hypothetical protein
MPGLIDIKTKRIIPGEATKILKSEDKSVWENQETP